MGSVPNVMLMAILTLDFFQKTDQTVKDNSFFIMGIISKENFQMESNMEKECIKINKETYIKAISEMTRNVGLVKKLT